MQFPFLLSKIKQISSLIRSEPLLAYKCNIIQTRWKNYKKIAQISVLCPRYHLLFSLSNWSLTHLNTGFKEMKGCDVVKPLTR